jgi:hypothetical protein
MRPLFRNFAMTLVIGALSIHSGHASAQDPVLVTVEPAPGSASGNKKCSDGQTGDAAGNKYVICADPDSRSTTPHGQNHDVTVVWTLTDTTGKGWMFPLSQGVLVDSKQNKKNSSGNQPWTITQASTSSYTATNTKDQKKYGYTINVINGNYLLTYDPTIMN